MSIWVICHGSLHGSTSAKLVAETKVLIAAHLKEVQGHEDESIPGSAMITAPIAQNWKQI